MTKEEKEQMIDNDLFLDNAQLKELEEELYNSKIDNVYLKNELEIYKKALMLMARDYNEDTGLISFPPNVLFYNYVKEAKEELEK